MCHLLCRMPETPPANEACTPLLRGDLRPEQDFNPLKRFNFSKSHFKWDEGKNKKLILERNISFEEVIAAIENKKLVAILSAKREHQELLLVNIRDYIFVVPFVKHGDEIFLKTIFPNRKMTKIYLGGQENE